MDAHQLNFMIRVNGGADLPRISLEAGTERLPSMMVSALYPRRAAIEPVLPDGYFWDDMQGGIVVDEDETLMELL